MEVVLATSRCVVQWVHLDCWQILAGTSVPRPLTKGLGGPHNWRDHLRIAHLASKHLIDGEDLLLSLIVVSELRILRGRTCVVGAPYSGCDDWLFQPLEQCRQKTKTHIFYRSYKLLRMYLPILLEIVSKQHSGQNCCWLSQKPARKQKHAHAYTFS
jgi:hypothetical protein